MTVEIKEMSTLNIEEMYRLAIYAFHMEDTPLRREKIETMAKNSWNYGAFSDGQLTSELMVTPFKVNFHGVTYGMGGIGYVASYPEYRGGGAINQIFHQILADMKERQVALSYLAPFSYPFYRRYGYEQAFDKIRYTLKTENLPRIGNFPGTVKRVTWENAHEEIDRLYLEDPKHQRGGLIRDDWWWHYTKELGKKPNYAVYYNEAGQAEGYLIYQFQDMTFDIMEWSSQSYQAWQGLARFVASHGGAFSEFTYASPTGEDRSYLLDSPLVKMEKVPDMMARIVDFQAFLSRYPFDVEAEDTLVLEVLDEYAPWNNGKWQLTLSPGKQPQIVATDEAADITASIQAWSQALLGYKELVELAAYDRFTGDWSTIDRLQNWLPKGKPVLADYF